ncbi:thioredoxin-like associated protein 2, putative [Hepatocystis sp. ex Piliocolobus tephrosceles]|nr:thioredoxin-like associated protein 2, putative [Hepatocystis sp. ex Piliocolobus tephrosceles]
MNISGPLNVNNKNINHFKDNIVENYPISSSTMYSVTNNNPNNSSHGFNINHINYVNNTQKQSYNSKLNASNNMYNMTEKQNYMYKVPQNISRQYDEKGSLNNNRIHKIKENKRKMEPTISINNIPLITPINYNNNNNIPLNLQHDNNNAQFINNQQKPMYYNDRMYNGDNYKNIKYGYDKNLIPNDKKIQIVKDQNKEMIHVTNKHKNENLMIKTGREDILSENMSNIYYNKMSNEQQLYLKEMQNNKNILNLGRNSQDTSENNKMYDTHTKENMQNRIRDVKNVTEKTWPVMIEGTKPMVPNITKTVVTKPGISSDLVKYGQYEKTISEQNNHRVINKTENNEKCFIYEKNISVRGRNELKSDMRTKNSFNKTYVNSVSYTSAKANTGYRQFLKKMEANKTNDVKLKHSISIDLDENSLNLDEGLRTFDSPIVVDKNHMLKKWNGYNWEKLENGYNFFIKARYDNEGNIWLLNNSYEILKLIKNRFKKIGNLANEEIVDIDFDKKNILWAVNRKGELLKWNKIQWKKIKYTRFHRVICIAFDNKGNLWGVNSERVLAIWDVTKNCWNEKKIKGNIKIASIAFDSSGRMWVISITGALLACSCGKWVNFGFMSFDELISIGFKKDNKSNKQLVVCCKND